MVIMMIAVVGQYYSVRLHAIQMLCADQMECKQCCKEELERAEHSREKIKINLNSRNRHLFFLSEVTHVLARYCCGHLLATFNLAHLYFTIGLLALLLLCSEPRLDTIE